MICEIMWACEYAYAYACAVETRTQHFDDTAWVGEREHVYMSVYICVRVYVCVNAYMYIYCVHVVYIYVSELSCLSEYPTLPYLRF